MRRADPGLPTSAQWYKPSSLSPLRKHTPVDESMSLRSAYVLMSDVTAESYKKECQEKNLRVGLRLDDALHHDFAEGVPHGYRSTFRMHIHTDIFNAGHKRVLLSGEV